MSKRNKLDQKAIRRAAKNERPVHPRNCIDGWLPDDIERLTDVKGRLGSPIRKSLMRAHGMTIEMPESTGPTLRDKAIARFRQNTFAQLRRRVHQYWARAAGAHNRAEKLVEGSRFAAALNRLERVNLALLALCQDEIARRQAGIQVLN